MPRGDKTKYTDKQKRQAGHITESYEEKGVPAKDAEGRAWATVNKVDGGGKKSGSGRGAHPAVHKGGQTGGTPASRSAAEPSDSVKSAATRKRHAGSASS
jgi:plasmid stabilization system protein ParE